MVRKQSRGVMPDAKERAEVPDAMAGSLCHAPVVTA